MICGYSDRLERLVCKAVEGSVHRGQNTASLVSAYIL